MDSTQEQTRSVVIEKVYRHRPEKIWRALTDPALLTEWLLKNDFLPEPGREFQFRSEPAGGWDGVIRCKVLHCEPLRRLAYSWSALGLQSTVEFTLTAEDGGTRMRMEHTGFRADQDAAYKGAQYGWQRFLGKLEQVLDEAGA